jgi:hypothetical protein
MATSRVQMTHELFLIRVSGYEGIVSKTSSSWFGHFAAASRSLPLSELGIGRDTLDKVRMVTSPTVEVCIWNFLCTVEELPGKQLSMRLWHS